MSGAARRKTPEQRLAEGNALAAGGRYAEAAQIFRALIREHPSLAELRFNLGNALKGQGDLAGAERAYLEALRLKPGLVDARFNLANTCRDQMKAAEAASAYAAVLQLDPGHVGACINAASLLQDHGTPGAARRLLERALLLAPGMHAAANLLGLERKAAGDLAGAAGWLTRAACLEPGHAAAWSNLGDVRRALGEFAEAERNYRTAVELDADNPEILTNLGIIQLELHRPEAGVRLHERALALNAGQQEARWNLALASLALGDLARGWTLYESRFAAGATPPRTFDIPAWDGTPLDGRRLLIWREQGIGDELMWSTCLPDALMQGDCVVECDPRVVSLFGRSFPRARVRAESKAGDPQDADCQVAIASLPLRFRPSLASFPREPVLVPDPALVAKWQTRLGELGAGLKIGLSWRSLRTRQVNQTARTYTRLADWQPLAALSGVRLVSLQYDDDPEERRGFPLALWPDLDLKNDFENVAALIAALDGVVSVSNTVAALAGGVGQRVVELALDNDWSLLGTKSRPWFPRTTCLVRGGDDSDWQSQIESALRLVADWRTP